MTRTHTSSPLFPRRSALALAISVLALAGCGGGSDATSQVAATDAHPMNGVGSGGTGRTLSIGPVSYSTSLMTAMSASPSRRPTAGSTITVNSVAYATASAQVYDDEGNTRSSADLHAGSTVVVSAGMINNGHAKASSVELVSDVVGAVDLPYDAATGMLRVIGQSVVVNADTALDALPAGAASLTAGTLVEVSSLYDPITGNYVATRIDPKAGATHYKVRGKATAVDTRARTFKVNGQVFSYAALPGARIAENQGVAVDVLTRRNAAGQWVVSAFLAAGVAVPEGTTVGVSGVAVAATDATHFIVSGLPVDASRAAILPAGSTVANQSRVEVQGTVLGGELLASRVTVKASGDQGGNQQAGASGR